MKGFTACPFAGKGAWSTDEGVGCGTAFCGFNTLFKLAWAEIPEVGGAAVFCLAMFARAAKIADVF